MKGVTLATYSKFLGRKASKAELRAISAEHLQAIYKTGYWDKAGCDALPPGVDAIAFDIAVNSGPARALKFLRETRTDDPAEWIEALCRRRMKFFRSLGTFDAFGKGWTRRNDGLRAFALKLAAPPVARPVAGVARLAATIPAEPASAAPEAPQAIADQAIETDDAAPPPSMASSKTGWASIVTTAAGGAAAVQAGVDAATAVNDAASDAWSLAIRIGPWAILAAVILAGGVYIWRRHRDYKTELHAAGGRRL